jgi:hypothetical protein
MPQFMKTEVWLFMIPNDQDKYEMMACAVRDCIAPAVMRVRKALATEAQEADGKMSAEPQAAEKAQMTLSFDGENHHLLAIMEQFCLTNDGELKKEGFKLVKFSAATSHLQQPCDVSPSFRALKSSVRTLFSRPDRAPGDYPELVGRLEEMFAGQVEPASRKTFMLFLTHLPDLLSAAFTVPHVTDGWRKTGYSPFSTEKILSRCTTWGMMTPTQQEALMQAADSKELQAHAELHGGVSDEAMQAAIPQLNVQEWLVGKTGILPPLTRKPLQELVLNRQRATIVDNEEVVAAYTKEYRRKAPTCAKAVAVSGHAPTSSTQLAAGGAAAHTMCTLPDTLAPGLTPAHHFATPLAPPVGSSEPQAMSEMAQRWAAEERKKEERRKIVMQMAMELRALGEPPHPT